MQCLLVEVLCGGSITNGSSLKLKKKSFYGDLKKKKEFMYQKESYFGLRLASADNLRIHPLLFIRVFFF